MKYPVVSIGIPVYNVAKYLNKCLVSIMKQSYQNLDIIIVNDCSTDNSVDIIYNVLHNYPQKNNLVRVFHHEKNRGLAAARNTVLKNAKGEFIMWVDGDDWLSEDAVERAVNKQVKGDFDIVSFGYIKQYINNHKVVMSPYFIDSKDMCLSMIWRGDHHVWGRLIRKSLYDNNKIDVKEGINMGEDYQVMSRLAYYSEKVCTLNEPLYYYNCTNTTSYMAQMSEKSKSELSISESIVYNFFNNKGLEYRNAILKNQTRQFACEVFRKKYITSDDVRKINKLIEYTNGFPLHIRLLFILKYKPFIYLYLKIHSFIEKKIKGL